MTVETSPEVREKANQENRINARVQLMTKVQWSTAHTPASTIRALYEAMATTGTDEQVNAFVKFQVDVNEARTISSSSGKESYLGMNGRTNFNDERFLNGPVVRAAMMYQGEGESGPDSEWIPYQEWNIDDLGWPGLVEAMAVTETLDSMKGGYGENFRPSIGEDVATDVALNNLRIIYSAVYRKQMNEMKPGDNLVIEVVHRMGIDPGVLAESFHKMELSIIETELNLSRLMASIKSSQSTPS